MNRTFRKPLYKRLEPVNAWRGGWIENTDLLTLAEAAKEASKHAGVEITAADFLRAAGRGGIALRAIVHATAKVEKYDGGIYCNQGMPTENSIPKGAIPTLPLEACMQLANTGTASWRTFEGFDYDMDGDWCRFDIAWLAADEPDFETVADDCRVTGYDVHALADKWLAAQSPAALGQRDEVPLPPYITTSDLVASFGGYMGVEDPKKVISEYPDWATKNGALIRRGTPGRKSKSTPESSAWNPVQFALNLLEKRPVPLVLGRGKLNQTLLDNAFSYRSTEPWKALWNKKKPL